MPDPVLTGMTGIRTALIAINGSAPYTNTVTTAEYRSRDWSQVPESARTYIGLHLEKDLFDYAPTSQVYGSALVHLICLQAHQTNDLTRLTGQIALKNDVFEALHPVHTASSFAGTGVISVSLVEVFYDASDVDSKNAMRIVLLLKYRRSSRAA